MKVVQAYRFALDPMPAQERALRSHAGASRFAWNWGLGAWKDRYEAESKWWSGPELHKLWNVARRPTRKLTRRLENGTARILSATVSRTAHRWHVSFTVEVDRKRSRPARPARQRRRRRPRRQDPPHCRRRPRHRDRDPWPSSVEGRAAEASAARQGGRPQAAGVGEPRQGRRETRPPPRPRGQLRDDALHKATSVLGTATARARRRGVRDRAADAGLQESWPTGGTPPRRRARDAGGESQASRSPSAPTAVMRAAWSWAGTSMQPVACSTSRPPEHQERDRAHVHGVLGDVCPDPRVPRL